MADFLPRCGTVARLITGDKFIRLGFRVVPGVTDFVGARGAIWHTEDLTERRGRLDVAQPEFAGATLQVHSSRGRKVLSKRIRHGA